MRAETGAEFLAHPRVGGENDAAARGGAEALGSSPRGRGKRSRVESPTFSARLIPAWAGKTSSAKRLTD